MRNRSAKFDPKGRNSMEVEQLKFSLNEGRAEDRESRGGGDLQGLQSAASTLDCRAGTVSG